MADKQFEHQGWESPGLKSELTHSSKTVEHDAPEAGGTYPRMLYLEGNEPLTVASKEEHAKRAEEGWLTIEETRAAKKAREEEAAAAKAEASKPAPKTPPTSTTVQ